MVITIQHMFREHTNVEMSQLVSYEDFIPLCAVSQVTLAVNGNKMGFVHLLEHAPALQGVWGVCRLLDAKHHLSPMRSSGRQKHIQ